MTRREVRDCAFKLVFEQLLRDDDIEELFEIADEVDEITVDDQVRELTSGVVNHGEGMALAQNEAAMTKFAALSESEKQKIIDGTHFVESKSEMNYA